MSTVLVSHSSTATQTERDWKVRRLIKSHAEADYFKGYQDIRSAPIVSVFWEWGIIRSGSQPKIRGKSVENAPVLYIWVWNNTDKPHRLEPSAMRFVWRGREYVRNNNATLKDALEPTEIPPRTIYYGSMVMNVPTGQQYSDAYGLKYTSPRPAETWVLNKWLYWKNAMSNQEFLASLEKAKYYRKQMLKEGDSTLRLLDLTSACLTSSAAVDSELQKTMELIKNPKLRTGAGIWEDQVILLRSLGIPRIFQTYIPPERSEGFPEDQVTSGG